MEVPPQPQLRCIARPLTVADGERDYEAVTESRNRLRGTFGPTDEWPTADLTFEGNRIDLAWLQKEFQHRDAFAYAVVDPDETVELGCVYVQPTQADGYDVAVYFCISDSGLDRGLAEDIESHVCGWLNSAWPFGVIAYSARGIPWFEWSAITHPNGSDLNQ